MTASLMPWLGKRVRFEHGGNELIGTVRMTLGDRLQIVTDGCEHRGCKDHPPRWYGRHPDDVTAV